MAITQEATGSHTISSVGSEETPSGATLSTPSKTYVLVVDCDALAAGEYVEIKIKRDVRSADSTRTMYSKIVSWLEGDTTGVIQMPPVPAAGGEITFTLKQIGGSARAFPWAWETPG